MGTPDAMCGYFAVANALLLSRSLPFRWRVTREELEKAFVELQDPSEVAAKAESMMQFLQQCRKRYVNDHLSDFHGAGDDSHYMRDWVANYEISDYLCGQAEQELLPDNIHFFRYNQMPEIETATHEERMRLEEERCFGVAVSDGDKVTAKLEPGATRFIVERFTSEHALLRPEHWFKQKTSEDQAPPVFVVDVNDHFVAAVPLFVVENPSKPAGEPVLIVVNTTGSSYLRSPALVYLFDLAFGKEHGSAVRDVTDGK